MSKVVTLEEAIDLIKDGDTIWVNAFAACASPVDLNKGITYRFRKTGHPKNLSIYSSFSFSDWKKNSDVEGYICEGAVDRAVIGFFGSLTNTCQAIMDNKIEGYNLPGGIMSHMIRASACGASSLFSKIGLNLFVDPRLGHQYQLNERSKLELVHLAEEKGELGLLYDIPRVDIALLKASYADERGNITFENECASIDALSVAQATHRNGGKVIVQVARIVNNHMPPRTVNVPAALVDAVVVCPHQQQLTNVDGFYDYICGKYVPTGNILKACKEEISEVIGATSKRNELHKAIAARAVHEIEKDQIVNIGIGIPELVAAAVLERNMLEDVHLSVESGHTGGLPLGGQAFGVAIGPDSMMDMARQFDFYEGGGLDLCFIGALEVDGYGNVNGHYTKGKLSGIGGFANISQTTKKVVFCFTFTSKGIDGSFDGKTVTITKEGQIRKFVENVGSFSFSVKNAYANKQEILYVTERCVFRLGPNGLVLTEVAPGIDLQTQILDLLPFNVEVADDLKEMEF
ncbi:MAG: malonate decarboxylase subunit alpha [Clostridiales bacterium]|nr:malonate decarboxylase subunit alpha [Clostridiales bacterium]